MVTSACLQLLRDSKCNKLWMSTINSMFVYDHISR
jgi:hypothetical protein